MQTVALVVALLLTPIAAYLVWRAFQHPLPGVFTRHLSRYPGERRNRVNARTQTETDAESDRTSHAEFSAACLAFRHALRRPWPEIEQGSSPDRRTSSSPEPAAASTTRPSAPQNSADRPFAPLSDKTDIIPRSDAIAAHATKNLKLHLLMRRQHHAGHVHGWLIPLIGALTVALAYWGVEDAPDNHATAVALDTARITAIAKLADCPQAQPGDTAVIVANLTTSADAHTARPYRAVHCMRIVERRSVIAAR